MAAINAAVLQALRTMVRSEFQNALTKTEPLYLKIASVVPSNTKSNTYGWLGSMPTMREWIGARVINSIKEHGYSITNRTFETTIGISRDDVEDDTLDNYLKLQAEKKSTILSYIESANITKKQALELLRAFHPCSSVMVDLDRRTNAGYSQMLVYFDKVRKNHLLPRQYFTKLQLELMDVIQTKFNVQVLE